MERFASLSLACAVIATVTNILMISLSGVPVSIPLGIFAIAFAIITKEDNNKIKGKAKTGLILAIIALVFGILIFVVTIVTTTAMSDPVMSKKIMEMINSIKGEMPVEMQEMFEQMGF